MIRILARLFTACAILVGTLAHAQVSYTGGVYHQNFDTLPGTTNNTLNAAWPDNTTLPGWYASKATFSVTDGTVGGTAATFDATSAANNVGLFSFGTASSTDRALGSRATSQVAGNDPVLYGVRLVNNTSQTLTRFTVIYTGEQWFASTQSAAHTLLLDYQLGAQTISAGTWTAVTAGTFTAPIATGTTARALPGNTAANRTVKQFVVTGISWAPGAELWVRFRDANESGNEQGLGVDDFSFLADNETGLYFNGSSSYVTMGFGTASATAFGASSFTLECRVLKTGAGATASTGTGGVTALPLIAKGVGEAENSNIDANYFLGIDANGKLCADFEQKNATNNGTAYAAGQNFPITGSTTLQNGVWYHLAATYDATTATWKLYVNGVEETGVTMPITPFVGVIPRDDSIQGLGIGTTLNSAGARAGFFQGIIDEARIWNVARTGAQIGNNKDVKVISGQAGMLARFGFDEGTGTVAAGTKSDGSATTSGTLSGTVLPQWVNARTFTPNVPPTVTLTSPATGSSVTFPAAINLAADAADTDGSIAKVEFFNGATKIGEDLTSPYTFAWTGVAVGGPYSITAVATDNGGGTATSAAVTVSVLPNPNQPPVVTVVSPADNATGIGSSTTLNLSVTDNEGDAQTVNFFGRVTTPLAPGADFTIIQVPDTQYYSENTSRNPSTTGNPAIDTGANAAIYNAQMQWIVDNRTTRNIAFVSHMGDIAQNGDANESEWIVASNAQSRIENPATTFRAHGIPWGVAPGNHDQQPVADAGGVTNFYTKYFHFTRWENRPYFGGHFGTKPIVSGGPQFPANNNNYQLFSASGMDFIIIHLEYDARAKNFYQATLDWADAVLKAYPNRRAIITSHGILNTGNPAAFFAQGQNIYDDLKDNPNLFLTLCGHTQGEGRRTDVFQGRSVHSILSDYQETKNGGNGFLRILTFKPSTNQIRVESYSPTLNRAVDATDSIPAWTAAYDLTYNMQTAVTDWIPLGSVNVAASGTTASLSWTGLEAGQNYEWYATVNDGINTATTAARRFSTTPLVAPTVTLTSPAEGSSAGIGATVSLAATATDTDGTIARVEFFDGGTKLGEATTAPYTFAWTGATPGAHLLTAVATDNSGLDAISSVVTFTISNIPPTVVLADPDESESFGNAPASTHFEAIANDADGTISKVEFYANATKVGEVTTPLADGVTFVFNWNTGFTGAYTLSARAIDNFGAATTSTEVRTLFVTNPDNEPPTVAYTIPTAGADYAVGSAIALAATSADSDGFVVKVEFFEGANKLGEDTTAPFTFSWSGAVAGSYSLTAVATDNDGGITTSAPVAITVSPAGIRSILSTIVETFDTMGTVGTVPPNGWSMKFNTGANVGTNATWTDSIPIAGNGTISVASQVATAGALSVNNAPTANNNNGYNAQGATTADRVIATAPTGGAGMSIQVQLRNNSGNAVNSVRIGYDIRRYLAVATANELPGYWLFYSLDGGTTWTNVAALNPTVAGANGVIVPNTVGVTTVPLTTFNLSSVWSNGADLLLRWVDDNAVATSPDQIVGLDNVTITAVNIIGNPPSVTLTAPLASDSFNAPATVNLAADASDPDGTISKVEFYNGATKIGENTTGPAPYTYTWTNVATGTYTLTARATDNDGNVVASSGVDITVNPAPGSGTMTRSPYLNSANHNSIVVRWRTSQSVAGRVRYGTTPTNLNLFLDESVSRTNHEVKLIGLTPYTRYYYSVGSPFDTLTPETAETTSFTPGAPVPTAADYTFRTSPTPGTPVNTRIWIVGDCGRGTQVQASGRDAYYSSTGGASFTGTRIPDLNLQLGDNAYNSGTETEYQSGYFNMYANIFRKMPQWSTLGNHDANNGDTNPATVHPYFNMFTFPTAGECGGVPSGTEHYYSFDYGNIHFVCLDSQASSTAVDNPATTTVNEDGPMAAWLRLDLASTTQTWIIAFWHHPPYSKGSHDSDTETQMVNMRSRFNPIMEAGGVDVVFLGHSHNYERSVLLDGHYGISSTISSAMKFDTGNGSTSGFTMGASGVIRRAPLFTPVATVSGTVVPPDGAYLKPLTGPRDHFGAVYNTAGMSGLADAGAINHAAMYISYNTVGTVNVDVNGNTLTATFVQTGGATPDNFTITKSGAADGDSDGMADEWEIANGLDRRNPNDAALDKDGDGLTNLQEYRAGTNPNDAADKPKVASLAAQPDGSVVLQIPTTAGKAYRVEANNAFPTGTWSIVGDNIPGTGALVAVPDAGADGIPSRIYRVTVLP